MDLGCVGHPSRRAAKGASKTYQEFDLYPRLGELRYQLAAFLLHPQPTSGTLTLYYHGEFPALSADSDTNVLTDAAPDLIIYAALTFASDFYLDARAELFEVKFTQFLTELQEQANDQELQGGTQSLLPAYSFQDE